MEIYTWYSPLIVLAIALFVGWILNSKFNVYTSSGRFETIDGLRGFLALFVFVHHSSIWYRFLQIGKWEEPKSLIYNHFGGTSVAFFFMITAFLFVNKILNSTKPIDWKDFYRSRLLRLGPLFYSTLVVIFAIIFMMTGFKLIQSPVKVLKEMASWGIFGFYGLATINSYKESNLINAGVLWSLPYEWFFYFLLPFIFMAIQRKKVSWIVLIICGLICLDFLRRFGFDKLIFFVGGAVAPFILKYYKGKINFKHWGFSFVIIISIGILLTQTHPYSKTSALISTIIFTIIAMGNSVFGILKFRPLQFLGEISYSTYLIHGIILFCAFHFVIGIDAVKQFSAMEYWLTIFALTVFVVLFSFLTFKFIEKPGIDYAKKLR